MSLASPSTQSVQAFLFDLDDDNESCRCTTPSELSLNEGTCLAGDEKRQSMYVELLDEMLIAILNYESHLLHPSETDFVNRLSILPYTAKYLLIRLCLRKPGKWHRFSSLRYHHELGENIMPALKTLCASPKPKFYEDHIIKHEEWDVLNLTLDEMQMLDKAESPSASLWHQPNTEAGSSVKIEDNLEQPCGDLSFFAQDHTHADLADLIECLSLEELRQLAKDMRIKKVRGNRTAIESALIKQASSQSVLQFYSLHPRARSGMQPEPTIQTQLPFSAKSQCSHLRQMVMRILGICVRVNDSVFTFLRRLNLVYFRCTQYTSTILTPSILSRARRRTFPPYVCARSSNIWPTRTALLAYERALELEAEVDSLNNSALAPARARSRSLSVSNHLASNHQSLVKDKVDTTRDEGLQESVIKESQRIHDAREVLSIFEVAYAEWKALREGDGPRPRGFERFDLGHVLTRIVQKGAEALGTLKEYDRELEVLEALLNQRRWRRGRRGKWYERRALVLTRYGDKSPETLRRAMRGLIDSLHDRDTHLVYRPGLSRRLTALEKKMGISPDERHQEDLLIAAEDVYIKGIRLRNAAAASDRKKMEQVPQLDTVKKAKQSILPFIVVKSALKTMQEAAPIADVTGDVQKGKSTWRGRGDEVVNVETYVLQHYERLGYRGYHCEGRIITTLFGLLFWDIIFAAIPGAFETPYQAAPLDIFEDTFYHAREELVEARLDEISEGKARDIIQRIDDEHREGGTWCVGVRWDLFLKEDLLEIVERGSGVPDLFIWNYLEKHCKFVEVKGPGDRLQENQKLWIDVMQRAEVSVEVCHVEEQGKSSKYRRTTIKNKRSKKALTRRRKMKADESDWETSESEGEEEDELSASQYLQEYNPGPTLVRKRSVEETSATVTASETGPTGKRLRTS
ncbi:hypothetical protein B0F90DRAFT_1814554 [Multifurca ochricompacta]|uniref:Fanconi-associated nuclease n=1 Tax=Multifurca ochricompacta TaxID=376703 RepID=A0AAD4QPB4_9AGAM|nr:hypothetical protein B0F90DRAFT_1814554 [Multifurca ochricompacta]